jgi:hypothetical protein
MSIQIGDFTISSALSARVTPTEEGREPLTARHLERARRCCFELTQLADDCVPSTRVLVAYHVLLHDALAVLAFSGWRVAPPDTHADGQVLEVLAMAGDMKPRLSEGVRLAAAARESELGGVFASDDQARFVQATALDVHGLIELWLQAQAGTG